MKLIKYAGIGFGFQILFLLSVGTLKQFLRLPVLGNFAIGIYNPFINFILNAGNYRGESAMIQAPVVGILLGMFFYSVLLGLILIFFKRK